MGVISNKIDRKQLKPGDHIYSWRQGYLYAHHGIYVGEGMVIHFTNGRAQQNGTPTIFDGLFISSASSIDTDIPCQRCGDCREIKTNAKVRGGTCSLASSDPVDEVLSRANYLLEHGFGGYHLFKNNCEDFAVYCKTGLLATPNICVAGGSGQAATYSAAVNTVASLSLRFVPSSFYRMALVSCGTYCYKRLVSDIGFRNGVAKVPLEKIPEMAKVEN
ncbi:hypothetical protein TSUD_124060 [Trifolium subterraneum]|uniref:LRAT domain-containing protein n=1 Tax=Trifolium subterraneum TaxID=3900 RepID=A0A2Z6PFY5_TRISU|nr:hypothetical protein TSUD_124060 [Trifolium subterraneum]